jgi:hypothetical protein
VSLTFDHPHVETGDSGAALSGWEVTGFGFENNDHGRVYVRLNGATVEASKNRAFTSLVATGPDVAADTQLVLAPSGPTGLGLTAHRTSGQIPAVGATPITVWLFLANETDLRRKDNQLSTMLLRGEVDFLHPLLETMQEFLTRMAAIYPPAPTTGYPNDLIPNPLENARNGSPEWYAQFFWSLNYLGEFEITGLQNPGDYRLWFVNQCLATIYGRKARTGDESDPLFTRQFSFQVEADRLWSITKPWVTLSKDNTADRQPKIRNVRLRRG